MRKKSLILVVAFIIASTRFGIAGSDSPVTVGGHVELDFELEDNFDLDDGVDADFATLEPEVELQITVEPNPSFQAYLQLELARKLKVREEEGNKDLDTTLELEEANVTWTLAERGLKFRFGRQDFDDEREWLYDENLDGLRLFYGIADFEFELSATRQDVFATDLLRLEDKESINIYHVYGRYRLTDDIEFAAYWLLRDNRSSKRESPNFFGLRSFGEPFDGLKYWLELAHVRGRDGSADVRGYGADVGATYSFDIPYKPYLTLAYAFGSADRDSTDGTNEAFRQTGLQDNDARFGGVASFKYYGEVLNPELSNLMIYTAGIGFRPTRKSSFDVIYHHYQQAEASNELRDSDLDADPSGTSRGLGNEIDFVLAYREIPNLNLEAVLGYFIPGRAFGTGADNALFGGFEARYKF